MKRDRSFSRASVLLIAAVVLLFALLGCGLLPTSGGEPDIEFAARDDQIEPGECTVLEWEVQGAGDYPVFLDGEMVDASGKERVCLYETTGYKLVVGAPGGPFEEKVTISVAYGPRPAPTSPAPPPAPTTPPPPAATAAPRPPAPSPTSPPPAPAPTTPPPPAPTTPPPPTPTLLSVSLDIEFAAACSWVGVHRAGINSHQPMTWCPRGDFLTGLDLDREGAYDPLDSPVVGQAECCGWSYMWDPGWVPCSWVGVQRAGINSHQALAWCPDGSYLSGLDLDRGPYDPLDSPVVGQAECCQLPESSVWSSCTWVGVQTAGINSHQAVTWCPSGSFLAGLDLDRGPYDALDSPVVGQAYCCRP